MVKDICIDSHSHQGDKPVNCLSFESLIFLYFNSKAIPFLCLYLVSEQTTQIWKAARANLSRGLKFVIFLVWFGYFNILLQVPCF